MCILLPRVQLWCECWDRCRVEKYACGWVHLQVFTASSRGWMCRSNHTQESESGLQKTHWWCYRLLVLWGYVLTSCRSADSPVSRLSIALCLLERSACTLHDCKLLFAWLLTMGCEKISNFFFFKERSHMALVLVMFPGLQQPGLHEASRVNITICKGIQT